MANRIHASAIIEPGAQLGNEVEIGPFCVIGPHVKLGDHCRLIHSVTLSGHTEIGTHNTFHPHSVIGGAPQDKKYAGEPTRLKIGDRNTFRESVTINCGTVQDQGVTRIGNDNWIMAYVHIAHDCIVGDQTVLANCTQLAGHVHVGDWVILGGFTGVHQFCKIGAHAMAGVGSVVLHDIPPYMMVSGNTAKVHGMNIEGLKRRGFSADQMAQLRIAYKTLYKNGLTFDEAKLAIKEQQTQLAAQESESLRACAQSVAVLSDFLAGVTRGIVR